MNWLDKLNIFKRLHKVEDAIMIVEALRERVELRLQKLEKEQKK